MMQIVRATVACDTINIGTVDLKTEEGFHFDLDGFLMPSERRQTLPHFKNQHPMLEYARKNPGLNPPLRFCDFLSRRQFEETGLYRECYRGYTMGMVTFGIDAPEGLNISVVLSRSDGDFSDDEVAQLSILQPLISSVYHRLILEEAVNCRHLSDMPAGIIVGSGASIITLDAHAGALMERHFPNNSRHRLPECLARQVARRHARVQSFIVQPDGHALNGLVEHTGTEWILKIWQETGPLPSEKIADYGLTKRQVEVLQYVAMGRTNPEIAIILGISYRTVDKHLENIYRQIGVETRLAAVQLCRKLKAASAGRGRPLDFG
jgi:DNA-binding CsgD family transcriptional regulator